MYPIRNLTAETQETDSGMNVLVNYQLPEYYEKNPKYQIEISSVIYGRYRGVARRTSVSNSNNMYISR